jgi:Pectate lyase superfamily protein/Secretion system C-terminal sorting domain
MKKTTYFIVTLFFIFSASYSQNIAYPTSSSVKNLKIDFGAVGDGVADDTNALSNAMNSNFGGIIFIPNGVYKITNVIKKIPQGLGTFFHGQSKNGVIIKLADGAVGFENALNPKAMITCVDDPNGVSADVFYYQWKNFTIDAGNNPGAIALRFYSNNVGSLTDIIIKATNAEIGLDMAWRNQNGPNLINKVEIDGFKTGFYTNNILNSQTLSEITIKNCLIGIKAIGQVVSIEDLVTINVVEPVKTNSILTLINSTFTGGNGTKPAIDLQGGQLFARNISATGYTNMIGGQSTVSGTYISEWTPNSTLFNFTDHKPTSLNLPVQKAPNFTLEPDFSKWVSVNSFGASPNGSNVSAAFQQAIDAAAAAGKTTVYFEASLGPEPNWYLAQADVHVYGSVKHIIGLGFARIVSSNTVIPKIIIDANAAPVVKIENMYRLGGFGYNIVNNNTSTLIIEHMDGVPVTISGASETYINDFSSTVTITNPNSKVWARQLNTEVGNVDNIVVDQGKLWVLGLKTERSRPIIVRLNGSLEILGAHIYNTCNSPANPLFEVNNASASFACIREICFCGGAEYTVHVKETRGTATLNFLQTTPFRQWDLFSAVANSDLSTYTFDSNMLQLYPNPTNDAFYINNNLENKNDFTGIVTDVMGKKIKTFTLDNQLTKIDLSNQQSGIYFIEIKNQSNEVTHLKVIKQ